jgi:hypothetical protein
LQALSVNDLHVHLVSVIAKQGLEILFSGTLEQAFVKIWLHY